ncbi:MAG: hypothetical protein J5996_05045 [Prevotella sp.]|nr:hypothetical protein [Prevotella sp.]
MNAADISFYRGVGGVFEYMQTASPVCTTGLRQGRVRRRLAEGDLLHEER